jgi:hypothetical protein
LNKMCEGTPGNVLCATFDDKALPPYTFGGFNVVGQSPSPRYERGLWFDGNDWLEVQNLVLNHNFSIEVWLRIHAMTGTIVSVH